MLFECKGKSYNVFEHDTIFWAGDLNFRTNVKNIEEVMTLLKENKIESLYQKDQLWIEKSKGNIFKEFEEGQIKFWPTYKYAAGTNEFDKYIFLISYNIGKAKENLGGVIVFFIKEII